VRCVDCQREPDSPGRHCECCGRELAPAAASAEQSPLAEERPDTARLCAICGTPSPEDECCADCLGSFGAWACNEPAAEPVAPSAAEKTDQVDSLWSELMNTPAPPELFDLEPSPKQVVPTPSGPHISAVAANDAANIAASAPAYDSVQTSTSRQAAPPILASEMTTTIESRSDRPGVIHPEAVRLEPVRSPVSVPRPEPANAQPMHARSTLKPPPVPNHPHARGARPQSRGRPALLSAAVVVLAAGLGGYWFKVHGWLSPVPEPEAAVAINEPVRETRPAPPRADRANPAPAERSVPAAPKQVKTRVSPPRPAARQASEVTAKTRTASVPAPEPLPARVALPAVAPSLPEAPASAASTAPPPAAAQGPFFEPTDVTEAPRVATRVEPDVPEDLRGRARNEIVIVRILVSQSGRPSRVTVLRRSKTGPRLDDAVIAAVNQWTFSPARRRGEAVSSWYNMGVPIVAN
jgi:periplasmic protein TonB